MEFILKLSCAPDLLIIQRLGQVRGIPMLPVTLQLDANSIKTRDIVAFTGASAPFLPLQH